MADETGLVGPIPGPPMGRSLPGPGREGGGVEAVRGGDHCVDTVSLRWECILSLHCAYWANAPGSVCCHCALWSRTL